VRCAKTLDYHPGMRGVRVLPILLLVAAMASGGCAATEPGSTGAEPPVEGLGRGHGDDRMEGRWIGECRGFIRRGEASAVQFELVLQRDAQGTYQGLFTHGIAHVRIRRAQREENSLTFRAGRRTHVANFEGNRVQMYYDEGSFFLNCDGERAPTTSSSRQAPPGADRRAPTLTMCGLGRRTC
jgi:hypothetical protein